MNNNLIVNEIQKIVFDHENILCQVPLTAKISTSEVIKSCVEQSVPIILHVEFGGYKSHRVPSGLQCNWAEVFNIEFMVQLAKRIADSYSPGVVISYLANDICHDKVNNIPQIEIDSYVNSFSAVVDVYNAKNVNGVCIVLEKFSELVDKDKFEKLLDQNYSATKRLWESGSVRPELIDEAIRRAERNYRGHKSAEILFNSAAYHAAYLKTSAALVYPLIENRIKFIHRKTFGSDTPFVPYKSCHSSAVQFWVGEGCLVKVGSKYINSILSKSQLVSHTKVGEFENTYFSTLNPNLKNIPIYERQ